MNGENSIRTLETYDVISIIELTVSSGSRAIGKRIVPATLRRFNRVSEELPPTIVASASLQRLVKKPVCLLDVWIGLFDVSVNDLPERSLPVLHLVEQV